MLCVRRQAALKLTYEFTDTTVRLKSLLGSERVWTIAALVKQRVDSRGRPVRDEDGEIVEDCEFEDSLSRFEGTADEDSADQVLAVLDRMSQLVNGPEKYSKPHFKSDINGAKVTFFRVRKGDLRLVWFHMKGRVIVCALCYGKRQDSVSDDVRRSCIQSYIDAHGADAPTED